MVSGHQYIRDGIDESKTSWLEQRTAGTNLQESTTTTLPPNSRFGFFRNGNFLSPSEVDTSITHSPPVYDVPIANDDVWVVGGTDRNSYVPGFDAEGGIAFQTENTPSSGCLLPSNVSQIEAGYGTFQSGSLSGVPNEDFGYSEDGYALHIENGDADLRLYDNGSTVASLGKSSWLNDPFDDPHTNYDVSRFAVLRQHFDLYGAGDCTFFLKVRETGDPQTFDPESGVQNAAEFVELGTVGAPDDAAMRQYNHTMAVRVDAVSTVSGSPTFSIGPLELHNRFNGTAPTREKFVPYFTQGVSDSLGGSTWTVLQLLRIDITRREASTIVSNLAVQDNNADLKVQMRAVHRDNLTFGATDQDADSNWVAPGDSLVRETSVEEYTAPGEVSLDTFTDDDGVTKIHGEKELATAITSSGGNRTSSRDREGATPVSEYDYLALIAQSGDTTKDINLIEVSTEQRW